MFKNLSYEKSDVIFSRKKNISNYENDVLKFE